MHEIVVIESRNEDLAALQLECASSRPCSPLLFQASGRDAFVARGDNPGAPPWTIAAPARDAPRRSARVSASLPRRKLLQGAALALRTMLHAALG